MLCAFSETQVLSAQNGNDFLLIPSSFQWGELARARLFICFKKKLFPPYFKGRTCSFQKNQRIKRLRRKKENPQSHQRHTTNSLDNEPLMFIFWNFVYTYSQLYMSPYSVYQQNWDHVIYLLMSWNLTFSFNML